MHPVILRHVARTYHLDAVGVPALIDINLEIGLVDEPTANLDSVTGAAIIALMRKMQREHHVSFIFSSHDPQVLAEADDTVFLRDGRVLGCERRAAPGGRA